MQKQSANDQELITPTVMLGKLRFATAKWKCSGPQVKLPWRGHWKCNERLQHNARVDRSYWNRQHEYEGLSGTALPNCGYGTWAQGRKLHYIEIHHKKHRSNQSKTIIDKNYIDLASWKKEVIHGRSQQLNAMSLGKIRLCLPPWYPLNSHR